MKIIIIPTDRISDDNDLGLFEEEAILFTETGDKIIYLDPVKKEAKTLIYAPPQQLDTLGVETNINKSIINYDKNKITMQRVSSENAAMSPTPKKSGILTTFRFDDDYFAYQEWKAYNENNVYRRNWDNIPKSWSNWG